MSRLVRPTRLTKLAVCAGAVVIVWTAAFLLIRYDALPWLLPVHFKRNGDPNGWQYKTYARVLLPVFVQLALGGTLGGVSALLLSRPHGGDNDRADLEEEETPDKKAAAVAAEAVVFLAFIWVSFQAYGAWALSQMWMRERAGLGVGYTMLELTGIVLTILIAVRAQLGLGRPLPKPFNSEHWRLGHLYNNPADPALFVPTRKGDRWTLNFGRPVAAALMGLILVVGIVGPAVILTLLLR
ncbi:MAG TPA: DUF1648 domain-containing protein [Vicinamibacterales bacterium]|jgi:uncharacterized membrane protein|nr:DUF1648 domain-containing protein [Vicinamibacterales bacterium]